MARVSIGEERATIHACEATILCTAKYVGINQPVRLMERQWRCATAAGDGGATDADYGWGDQERSR